MKSLPDLFGKRVEPEQFERLAPSSIVIDSTFTHRDGVRLPYEYEDQLFSFLYENREPLGIVEVRKFKNLRIDGAVLLADGRRLAVEVKYCMNWTNALKAEYEFKEYLRTEGAKSFPVCGGIVFFERFQGDGWHRKASTRLMEDGWNRWYSNHDIDGYTMELYRFKPGRLTTYHEEMLENMALAASVLSGAEKQAFLDSIR